MKHRLLILLSILSLPLFAETKTLTSGDVTIQFTSSLEGYVTKLSFQGTEIPFLVAGQPAYLEVQNKKVSGYYNSVTESNGAYTCVATLASQRGSTFTVTDTYSALTSGQIAVQRNVKVLNKVSGDNYFNSAFGVQTTENTNLTDNEYLVPGVLYKGYFDAACNTPSDSPQESDVWFLYRDDRTPLPFVMSRGKKDGITINLAHTDSPDRTVVADAEGSNINGNYQFGACGLWRDTANTLTYQEVIFPGTTKDTKLGKGYRYHPVDATVQHTYTVMLSISKTDTYADAAKKSWNEVFESYNPTIYSVDLKTCYEGLIESLLTYYVPCRADGGTYDEPGWPFEVGLSDYKAKGIDYQMGFVGMQVSSGYFLYRYGIENKQNDTRHKGEAVLNFWADDCLSTIGMPRTWYDPSTSGTGSWRNYESILRVMTGGMEGLLSAWCYGTKSGETHDNWLSSCKKFGDWLLSAQNSDGSLAFSWNQNSIVNNQHPVNTSNGLTTTSALRYLVELYIATGETKYKEAALKAGNYCFLQVHKKYHYCACVVDNPQVLDSESGYMAMVGFLSLYDLTNDSKWLDAAQQAATYTETWVYSHEVPVEDDRTEDNYLFPRDRSIVGQHLIAIGHSAADLGFAWTSFAYYRLYLLTKNDHYLKMAHMSAHNSKQSMNWDQSLFPGQAKGLQLEAFQVMIPRRVGGVATTLNWNYAGHLDPMFRFKDAFGTPDLEEVEKMSWEDKEKLAERYALYQSANYGQTTIGADTIEISVSCPEKETAKTPDYYLNNMYYALCTSWTPVTTSSGDGSMTVRKDEGSIVLMNNDGNWFKLCSDKQYVDWHWDDAHGKSAIIYDNIYVSADGDYNIIWYQRNGGKVDVTVNGDTLGTYSAGAADTLTIHDVPLKANKANTIKIAKNDDWPQSLGIMLQRTFDIVTETTITLDMQDGIGGTTSVTAKEGCDMPKITVPTREGYFFEGYFTEDGSQYYNADGIGLKVWDKNCETYTLYAHWYDGGLSGDCPIREHALSEDWYLTHIYDARCTELTNTKEQDNGAYIYTNAENEKVKITASGEWMDFYYVDPSSIVFDSIYVSRDGYYDMTWYFRQEVVDGDASAGSRTQVWVNNDLDGEITTYISGAGVELDKVVYKNIELYADYPNKIKLLKVNGWPLTRGIQLSGNKGQATGNENVKSASFFVTSANGEMTIHRLSGESNIIIYSISGAQLLDVTTTASSYTIPMTRGVYVVNINGQFAKAVVH